MRTSLEEQKQILQGSSSWRIGFSGSKQFLINLLTFSLNYSCFHIVSYIWPSCPRISIAHIYKQLPSHCYEQKKPENIVPQLCYRVQFYIIVNSKAFQSCLILLISTFQGYTALYDTRLQF